MSKLTTQKYPAEFKERAVKLAVESDQSIAQTARDLTPEPCSMLYLLVASSRPKEWIKNSFLFAALFFSQNLFNPPLVLQALLAFGFYCLTTSGVYLMNDIQDREADKQHPQKRQRPIASGALPVALAAPVAVVVLLIALGGAWYLQPGFGLITTSYVLLNVAYSRWLKHIVILDIFAIAAGFVLRVIAGAIVINVVISHWILICTMLLALFLGFSKRRCELIALARNASQHRLVLAEYDLPFLDMMIGIVTSAVLMGYTLYTVSSETIAKFHTDRLLLTVPIVLYGIFRYLYLVYHRNYGDNPAHALLTDGPLRLSILLWGLVSALILYTAYL
jgi:4-hydroxybenzoate polyprenyltransferase